jgi:RimJ/RimL family protein N-acetyltransferase
MSQFALRPVEGSDLDAIFEQMRDPESVRMAAFTARDPSDRSAFDAHMAKIMSSSENRLWAIIRDARLVGTIGSYVSEGATEVTYWIDRTYWGQGIHAGARPAPRGDLGSADPSPCCERQRRVATSTR